MNKSNSLILNKRTHFDNPLNFPPRKTPKSSVIYTAYTYIHSLGLPLISSSTSSPSDSIRLEPNKPHTIGRTRQHCDFVFHDSRVSNQHCQIMFNSINKKILLSDGLYWLGSNRFSRVRVRVSLNGVFVNGARIKGVVELGAGDEVALVCANGGVCEMGFRIGFVVRKIVYFEEVFDRKNDIFGKNLVPLESCVDRVKLDFLLGQCRQILDSDDPVYCIKKCISPSCVLGNVEVQVKGLLGLKNRALEADKVSLKKVVSEVNHNAFCVDVDDINLREFEHVERVDKNVAVVKENAGELCMGVNNVTDGVLLPSPVNKFYLNRLQTMSIGSSGYYDSVSLPELLYPVESLQQIFIATFTSDIPWFLSYCEIPAHIPVTVACHNRDRCWSSSPDERISRPFSDFPHLVVVYPPFPEAIAFGNDRKNLGIACHHPKLFVLQREDSIRVVITSANLVSKQWNDVTNTVWWQDFPRASRPDYLTLFTQISGEINQTSESDFAAQLAGFMATLITDVPNEAHWITELTKYDFKGAVGHLVASVPGIHSRRPSSVFESMYFSSCASQADIVKALGSIETFVVGLSHLFRSSADSNGAQLKKLASFIQNCHENSNGMLEVVLKRNTNIPADVNAVSILVGNPKEFLVEDCVQLGFLPRLVAKWVAPLLDSGLFRFFGYVYPKQVLATALEGSTSKVHMLLYVSQGPSFSYISTEEYVRHYPAICSLVASVQRSTGIWRLNEVLSRYKWPENLETDFVFGSSSIGAVNAQFLAAFSAAVGKTSVQTAESEESDPDWGCWSASQELINPSMRIIFPTMERVKSASCGIMASRRMLCFSQKTWYRLRNVDILHDAIPYPHERINHPMHVKVARRRFRSKTDNSSFGWVYCGSHNFSAAAWGRPLSNSNKTMGDKTVKTTPILGSRLHISNYEFGIIFIVPPSDTRTMNLDDIVMPFVVPAPKYRPFDRPATPQTMREAYAELIRLKKRETVTEDFVVDEFIEEEIPNEEEEIVEASNYVAQEKPDEKAYAEALWSQVDSSQSC